MCKYCEQNIGSYRYNGVNLIYKEDCFGIDQISFLTQLFITGENGKPKMMVDVAIDDSFKSLVNHEVPINYCPMCGRKLVKEGDQNN